MSGRGLLMMIVGFWLIMRTVNQDSTGRTLVDHILGNPPTTTTNTGALGQIHNAEQQTLLNSTPLGFGINEFGNIEKTLGSVLP